MGRGKQKNIRVPPVSTLERELKKALQVLICSPPPCKTKVYKQKHNARNESFVKKEIMAATNNAAFSSTSPSKPSLLTISFAENPSAVLGVGLNNRDNVGRLALNVCVGSIIIGAFHVVVM
jgi:hypothetical protein